MSYTYVTNASADIGHGLTLAQQTVSYTNYKGEPASFETDTIEGLSTDGSIGDLALLALVLKHYPEQGALHLDGEQLESLLREYAQELAEDLEVPFLYEDRDGSRQEYTPKSMWEASGSCSDEWEQSAQEGYDYGWGI